MYSGVLIAHLSINVSNDYFDVKGGTDEANAEYFQQVSGGRAIELGLITLNGTLKLAIWLTLIATLIGALLVLRVDSSTITPIIIQLWFIFRLLYTAPPLRLVAKEV